MGSESKKLPIINFSNLKQQTPRWESVKSQVREALQEYGCFEAIFDEIPLHLRKSLLDDIQQLFDLPLQTKLRNKFDNPFHGYIGQRAVIPLYESLGIEDVLSDGQVDSFVNLMWPQGHPTFSKNVESYCEELSELEKIARTMVVESLGLEKYMDEHLNSTNYLIRVQKYNVPQNHESHEIGLTPHADNSMTTILYQDEVGGLQVQTKEGEWITCQPSPNSFILVVGTSLHAWTNGRLHPPHHRVMMTGDVARYSIGLFSIPKYGYMVKSPEEMVDEQHPLLFKPFDYEKFTDFYSTEAAHVSPFPLKTYCGV